MAKNQNGKGRFFMSNVKYEQAYYNEQVKVDFLSQYKTGSKPYERFFKMARQLEIDNGKDLFEFNRIELRRYFYHCTPGTKHASTAMVYAISKYIDWAIDEGLTSSTNELSFVDMKWKEQFALNINYYIRESEIQKIIKDRVNMQDGAIIALIFNGIKGEDNSEIVSLKVSDIDAENNLIKVGERIVPVQRYCIDSCLKAIQESKYEKSDGRDTSSKATHLNLVENSYVIRSAITKTDFTEEAEMNAIYRRITKVADTLDNPLFNPRTIFNSGMLHMGYKLYTQNGQLGGRELKVIAEKYNITSKEVMTRCKKQFLNVKTIEEVYSDQPIAI